MEIYPVQYGSLSQHLIIYKTLFFFLNNKEKNLEKPDYVDISCQNLSKQSIEMKFNHSYILCIQGQNHLQYSWQKKLSSPSFLHKTVISTSISELVTQTKLMCLQQ